MSKRKVLSSESDVKVITKIMRAVLGPDLMKHIDEQGIQVEDIIRFTPVQKEIQASRESQGMSLKDAAARLKVRQYKLRDIESGLFSRIEPEILNAYCGLLGLGGFMESWCWDNRALADKIGIGRFAESHGNPPGVPASGQEKRGLSLVRSPDMIYQLKITLRNSRPPIWRRVLVPGKFSLFKLHQAIQAAMGWTDSHLHQFIIDNQRYSIPSPDDWEPVIDERRHSVSRIVPREKRSFIYEYDFGDDWEHLILVEKILVPDPKVKYPVCTAGKKACPPEDVGGVYGYADFLEALRDPDHEEHDSYLEWAGGEFNPDALDLDEINRELRRIR